MFLSQPLLLLHPPAPRHGSRPSQLHPFPHRSLARTPPSYGRGGRGRRWVGRWRCRVGRGLGSTSKQLGHRTCQRLGKRTRQRLGRRSCCAWRLGRACSGRRVGTVTSGARKRRSRRLPRGVERTFKVKARRCSIQPAAHDPTSRASACESPFSPSFSARAPNVSCGLGPRRRCLGH